MSIKAIASQLTPPSHQPLDDMKKVQTEHNEGQYSDTDSPSDSEAVSLAGSAPTSFAVLPVNGVWTAFEIQSNAGFRFQILKL